ncbi:MAG TPA: M20/M25/M40 family metallo-hydrolase [Thermoanaerobaculia bacterium]|nr:M20/M25/M40 family metallo-hydrolase [Thermoanaerobaculia bacterium]
MSLGKNARRRLALYGGAAIFAALALWGIPELVSRRAPPVPVRRTVLEADAAVETEAVKLLVEYVRIDTTNPPGLTRPAIEFLARILGCEGIPVTVTGADPERPILVARLKGRSPEGALALLNHADVVPAGDPATWKKPPFAAERGEGGERDHLYGRGTLDMKGQTIANLLALASLARAGLVPLRDVVFVAESGEETYDESLGMGWLLDRRPDLLSGVTDVFNEGGVNEVKTLHVERFGIEVMQKAIVSADVLSKEAKPLEDFGAFLKARDESEPVRVVPAVREFLRFIAPSRSDVWGRLMLGEADKLGPGTEVWKDVPEVYRSLLKDSIYVGEVEKNADGFSMRVVRTLLPGSPVAAARAGLEAWVRERGLGLRLVLATADCSPSPAEGRAFRAAADVFALDAEAVPVGPYILSGQYTSASGIRARGLRAYGVSPFAVSIYDAVTIHHDNERISLPFFIDGIERMKRILVEFATAP